MAYIKALTLIVAGVAALGVFGEKDREKAAEYNKVWLEAAALYIIATIAEYAQNCLH